MTRPVDEQYEKIRQAEEELKAIRTACPHPSYSIRLFSWRAGAVNAARLCNTCDANLGQPQGPEEEAQGDSLLSHKTTILDRPLPRS